MTYQSEVLADSPLLYWRFKETSGTNADDSTANNRDGTYQGGVTLNQTDSPIASDAAARSILLDGVDDYVSSGYAPFASGSQRSFEGWFKRTNNSARQALFGSASGGVMLTVEADGATVGFWPDTGTVNTGWAGVWSGLTGAWVHWLLEFDDSAHQARLRIQGADQGLRTGMVAYAASPGNFYAGFRNFSVDYAKGNVAEVAVYSGLLGATRATAHIAAAAPSSPPTARTFWTRS